MTPSHIATLGYGLIALAFFIACADRHLGDRKKYANQILLVFVIAAFAATWPVWMLAQIFDDFFYSRR